MTKVYIADTTHSITVDEAVYTVTVASAASDTTVATSGSGTSLINTSAGGIHTLNSLTAGANITLTDDDAGNLTIAATEDNLTNNDTDDLSEGSTNQYFTDARVMTSLETVSGHVLPSADITYDLGSSAKQWRDVYVGPGSLYVNGQQLLSTETGIVNLTTDPSENLNVQAGGTITMLSTGAVTTMQDGTVNLGPADNSGTINARGDLNVIGNMDIDTADIGSLALSGIKISNTASNIELETNATGYIHADAADLYVGPLAGAVKIDEGSITTTAGDLTISATGSVDVAGHNTTAEQATLTATAKTEAIASAESKDAVRATAANAYADAAVAVLTSGADAAWDTLVEIKTLMDSGDTTLTNSIAALNHDTLSGFVANEHIDWTVTGNTIHADNYTDTDTTYTAGTNVSINGSNVISSTDTNTTYVDSDWNHDSLTGFVANEHIDWTVTGNTIHADNYTDTDTIYTDAEAISAVEGEDTLNFSEVTANDLSVRATGTINNETQHWPYYETYNEYYHLPLAEIPAILGGNSPAITAQSYNVTTAYLLRDADNNVDSPDVMTLTHQYDMDLSGNAGNELTGSALKFDVADELGEHPVADIQATLIKDKTTYGGSDRKTVEGVALTDPCQITSTGHGLSNDDIIRISQVNGTTELNDRLFKVSNTATDTFELKEKHPTPGWGWQDCDATGYSTYTDDDEGLIKSSYIDEFESEIVFKVWNKTGPAINNYPQGNLEQHDVLYVSDNNVKVKRPLQLASYTTTERDALAVADGSIIYNETLNKFQGYADSIGWVDLN